MVDKRHCGKCGHFLNEDGECEGCGPFHHPQKMKVEEYLKRLLDYIRMQYECGDINENSPIGIAWRDYNAVLKCGAQPAQSASPPNICSHKMPGVDELRKMLVATGEISEFGLDTNGADRVIELCHKVLVRHFGSAANSCRKD